MYDDIAEHQSVGETVLDLARIISYVLFLVVGLLQNIVLFNIVLIMSVVIYAINIILVAIFEHKYQKEKIENNMENNK